MALTDLIRPETRDLLVRWRQMIAAGLVAALGLYWALASFGILRWVGVAMVLIALALAVDGWQRLRFAQDGQGPGIVHVVERRLAYHGPLTGGMMDVPDIVHLSLEPQARPAPHWILQDKAGAVLEIPVNAAGADALFDVFATLPGIDTGAVLAALEQAPDERVTVWSRTRRLLH